MKLKFLGTAAAEGFPGLFCTCEVCDRAKKAGGRNIRTRSQAIIDDELLIDLPPDTYLHCLYFGLDLTKVKSCLITHSHSDHLYPMELEMRGPGFAHIPAGSMLTLYSSALSSKSIYEAIEEHNLEQIGRVKHSEVTAFIPFEIDGYTITPLKADHDIKVEPLIYIVSNGEKTLLYGTDTGYFLDETWDYLEENKPYLNLVSLDCTSGIEEGVTNHMGFKSNVDVKNRLIEIGCADEATIFISHHFSHNGKATYDDMVPVAAKEGFLVSYDGMEVEI